MVVGQTFVARRNSSHVDLVGEDPKAYVCYNCGGILYGRMCAVHHFRMCVALPSLIWVYQRTVCGTPPGLGRWIRCNTCMLQSSIGNDQALKTALSARSSWARLVLLARRRQSIIALFAVSGKHHPFDNMPLPFFEFIELQR